MKISTDRLVSGTAMFVAVASLVALMYQTYLMREAQLGAKGPPENPQFFLPELLKLFEIAEVPRAWYAMTKTEGGEKAVVEITYASVYGDRWRIRSDRLVPDEL